MLRGLFYLSSFDRFISRKKKCLVTFYYYHVLIVFIEIHVLNTSSVDHDQMLQFAASDCGLHCLPMSFLWDARRKWVIEEFLMVILG